MEKLCTRENALLAIEAVNEPRKKNKTAQWVESTKEARADELCELLRVSTRKSPGHFLATTPRRGNGARSTSPPYGRINTFTT